MKKIIIFISLCSVTTLYAAGNDSASDSYGLFSESNHAVGLSYNVGAGLGQSDSVGSENYSLFSTSNDGLSAQGAWVGVAGKYGELKLGSRYSLDDLAITSANQQRQDGAYELLLQDDPQISQALTYLGGSKRLSVGAQVATEDADKQKKSAGLLVNAQSRSVEAAVAYRQTRDEAKAVKGRLTYKSRNNSRVRVDLVAEKVAVNEGSESALTDSMSFMVGAKYNMTPKAYVVGQYGVVGFEENIGLSSDDLSENKNYNALSFEAGYSFSDKTSVYINHSQKSFDSELQLPFSTSIDGSQTNSIGVRLNW